MLYLRAQQVHGLYDYAAGYIRNATWRSERLMSAKLAMMEVKSCFNLSNYATNLFQAQTTVQNRESNYRISPYVVAGWRPNPTCYGYGYLWTVHSMFYFWRDYEKAIDSTLEAVFSPCFMNIINPINVAFGEGIFLNVTQIVRNRIFFVQLLNLFCRLTNILSNTDGLISSIHV